MYPLLLKLYRKFKLGLGCQITMVRHWEILTKISKNGTKLWLRNWYIGEDYFTILYVVLYWILGPPCLPIVGNLPLLKKLSKELGGQYLALEHLAKKYKTRVLGLQLGSDFVITVFSYEVVRQVLTKEEYEGRPNSFFLKLRCMGEKRGKF